jgi:hypothetical protein
MFSESIELFRGLLGAADLEGGAAEGTNSGLMRKCEQRNAGKDARGRYWTRRGTLRGQPLFLD